MGPSQRRNPKTPTYHYALTRHDLTALSASDIDEMAPLALRNKTKVKWSLECIDGTIPEIPKITRSQINTMSEALLPKEAIVTDRRRPKWIFRQIDEEEAEKV